MKFFVIFTIMLALGFGLWRVFSPQHQAIELRPIETMSLDDNDTQNSKSSVMPGFSAIELQLPALENKQEKSQVQSQNSHQQNFSEQHIREMDFNQLARYIKDNPQVLEQHEQVLFQRLVALLFSAENEPPFFKNHLNMLDQLAFYQNLRSIEDFKQLAAEGDIYAALPLAIFYRESGSAIQADLAFRQIYVNVEKQSQIDLLDSMGRLHLQTDPLLAHSYLMMRYQSSYGDADTYYSQNAEMINDAFSLSELKDKKQSLQNDLRELEMLQAVGNKTDLRDIFN